MAGGEWGSRWDVGFAIFNRVVREGFFKKVRFEQGHRGVQRAKQISGEEHSRQREQIEQKQECAWRA